jgi:hypothetical protein
MRRVLERRIHRLADLSSPDADPATPAGSAANP